MIFWGKANFGSQSNYEYFASANFMDLQKLCWIEMFAIFDFCQEIMIYDRTH